MEKKYLLDLIAAWCETGNFFINQAKNITDTFLAETLREGGAIYKQCADELEQILNNDLSPIEKIN